MARNLRLREGLRKQRRGQLGGAYQRPGKYPANTRCPRCNLSFQDGVWKRRSAIWRADCRYKLCPACVQVRDGTVGGIAQFSGAFAGSRRRELLNRIRNVEKRAGEERPLERIIDIEENKDVIVVIATTEHLAVRIGKSIQRDFGGELNLRYAPDDKFALVNWRRDS